MPLNRVPRPAIADLAVLSVVALTGLLVGLSLQPTTTSNPIGSPEASNVAARTSPVPTPLRSAGPNEYPPTAPPPGPCSLPETLPSAPPPVAGPVVEARDVAMLFTSYLYERLSDGSLAAHGEVGLWHVAPGKDEARLLLAAAGGMVLPLAISPSGDKAVVWWLPEHRDEGEPPCMSGIYRLSLADGSSRLLASGDWAQTGQHDPPTVAFSANGRYLSVVDSTGIKLYKSGGRLQRQHDGPCRDGAWAPTGAVFVAGCEEMTSAWFVRAGGGYSPESYALPLPKHPDLPSGWQGPGRMIGLTRDRDIRVVRFYGFATGCESPGCFIPPPAWAATTLDPAARNQTLETGIVDFLVWGARMSPDATWVYDRYPGDGARVVDVETGDVIRVRSLGTPVGGAINGSLLFGSRLDQASRSVLVSSLDRTGTRRQVATIGWPDLGHPTEFPVIRVFGLRVTVPAD